VGLITHDWRHVLEAFDVLDVGGLVVGDVPTVRADLLPYGGSGATGLGREGVAFALEAMTQSRSLLVRREPKG
jgi:acyl-CoA reductase-like NAD-dependent aldehyde dehydrogenase